jgi:hypothetical protein
MDQNPFEGTDLDEVAPDEGDEASDDDGLYGEQLGPTVGENGPIDRVSPSGDEIGL